MNDIENLFSKITPEARAIENYINKQWPRQFFTDLEVQLSKLFPEPSNKGLKHIWTYGSADVCVFRKDTQKLICIIEPGGSHHMKDDKQIKNDKRKWKLCEINDVKCLHLMNNVMEDLSKRRFRKLLGSYLFKMR